MESFNLASVWKLPLLFVCKNNSLAITTDSSSVTAGTIPDRIKGFGIPVIEVEGSDVGAVWEAGFEAVNYIREGKGPYFIHALCVHHEGHFLGDPLLSITRDTLNQVKLRAGGFFKAVAGGKGTALGEKFKGVKTIASLAAKAAKQSRKDLDPVTLTRKRLSGESVLLKKLEEEVNAEIEAVLKEVLSSQKEDMQS